MLVHGSETAAAVKQILMICSNATTKSLTSYYNGSIFTFFLLFFDARDYAESFLLPFHISY